jgi:hypothetical protein
VIVSPMDWTANWLLGAVYQSVVVPLIKMNPYILSVNFISVVNVIGGGIAQSGIATGYRLDDRGVGV